MRFLEIVWILSKYTLFYKLGQNRKKNLGQRLKLAFEELGLTFIKIGQVLSMRYDLLPRKDCEALHELLDNVNPIPFEEIVKIVEKEYGKPWREVFAVVYSQPLGSASVSQVHKAELFDGTKVAVKVKRPDVAIKFISDINILKRLARIVSFFSPTLRHFQIKELVIYFENWLKQDIDFILEVRNMEKIGNQYEFGRDNVRPHLGRVFFTKTFNNLCTENIIVMDFIDGIPMNRKEQILSNPNYNAYKRLKTYLNAAIRNWFRDDVDIYSFQADPHLSNILALPNGDVANVDCGLIAELSKKEADICRELIIAVYTKDVDKTLEIATEMTGVSYEEYVSILRPDLEKYLKQSENEGLGFWFMEFIKIMIKHRIKFPLFLTTFGRANLVMDGLVTTYMPEQTTLEIVGQELRRQAIKEMFRNIANADWLKVAFIASKKIQKTPDLIARFIEDPIDFISKIVGAAKGPYGSRNYN